MYERSVFSSSVTTEKGLMAYLVLARKWRPQIFEELVGQEPIARILTNAITNNKVAHAYIFSGPRGVGKTSTARILAKALNCQQGPTPEPCGKCPSCLAIADGSSIDVSEIDGASNTGVDNIRDLRERVRYAPSGSRSKIYIIDEAHMLSTAAFNALLKTLEEPPPHVIFVLATTEPKKIPPTVLSRCQHLPFRRVSRQAIKKRLKFISEAEDFKVSDQALDMIARAGDGSIRDSLTILDQIASFAEDIGVSDIKDLLGITDIETLSRLAAAVIKGNGKEIITIIAGLVDTGTDLRIFTKDFLQFIRNLLITKIVEDTENIVDLSDEESSAIALLREATTEEHVALLLSELIKAEPSIRGAFYPRIALEMILIKLSLLSHFTSVTEALKMLRAGEPGVHKTSTEMRQTSETPGRDAAKKVRQRAPEKEQSSASGVSRHPISTAPPMPLPEAWNAALAKLEDTNHPLVCKVREGIVSFDQGIRLVFNGGLSVHAESVKENLLAIRTLVDEIAGRKIPIRIETAEAPSPSKRDLREKALSNPIIKEALELFEGKIVDVIPSQDKGGDNV